MCPQLSCHLRKAQIPHWAEQAHPSAPDSAVDFTYTAHCCSHLRQTPDQHQNCFSLNRGIKKKKKGRVLPSPHRSRPPLCPACSLLATLEVNNRIGPGANSGKVWKADLFSSPSAQGLCVPLRAGKSWCTGSVPTRGAEPLHLPTPPPTC